MVCLLVTLGIPLFFGFSCTVLFPAFAQGVLGGGAFSFLTPRFCLLPNLQTIHSPSSLVCLVLGVVVVILIPSLPKEAVTSQGSGPSNED